MSPLELPEWTWLEHISCPNEYCSRRDTPDCEGTCDAYGTFIDMVRLAVKAVWGGERR